MHEKLVPSLSAGEGQYNVLIVDSYWVGEFKTAGWLAPLDDFITRDKVDTSVYIPSLMELNGRVQGVTYMLPFWQYAMGVLYRQDITDDPAFQAAYKEKFGRDWRFPPSLEEFAEVVKWAGQYKEMHGIAMAAQRVDPVVMEATNYLFSLGGDFYDRSSWQPALAAPEAAKSIDIYNDLLKNAAQPGALGANFDDVANTLKQGKAIFAITYLFLYPTLQNPADCWWSTRSTSPRCLAREACSAPGAGRSRPMRRTRNAPGHSSSGSSSGHRLQARHGRRSADARMDL